MIRQRKQRLRELLAMLSPTAVVMLFPSLLKAVANDFVAGDPAALDAITEPIDSAAPAVAVINIGLATMSITWRLFKPSNPEPRPRPHQARDGQDVRPVVAFRYPQIHDVTHPDTAGEYAEAVAAVTAIKLAWFEYETDPILAFRYPQIHDVTHPDTVAFLTALETCPAFETYPGDDIARRWIEAAPALIAAWDLCETSAKATGLGAIPDKERALIERAILMLNKGLDPAATPAERTQFVQRAYEIVAPIALNPHLHFTLPTSTVEALQVAIRGELANPEPVAVPA